MLPDTKVANIFLCSWNTCLQQSIPLHHRALVVAHNTHFALRSHIHFELHNTHLHWYHLPTWPFKSPQLMMPVCFVTLSIWSQKQSFSSALLPVWGTYTQMQVTRWATLSAMSFMHDTMAGPEQETSGQTAPHNHYWSPQYCWSIFSVYCKPKCLPFLF